MPTIAPKLLAVAPEVADALRHQRPVVALESTLISHGLPYPQNVEVATASEDAIREADCYRLHTGNLMASCKLVEDALHARTSRTEVRNSA